MQKEGGEGKREKRKKGKKKRKKGKKKKKKRKKKNDLLSLFPFRTSAYSTLHSSTTVSSSLNTRK